MSLRPVLFLAAMDEELSALSRLLPAGILQRGVAVLALTGVGALAGPATEHAIAASRPCAVVDFGVCGALDRVLLPGDLVIGERVIRWDAPARAELRSDPALMAAAAAAAAAIPGRPRCRRGILVTGDLPVTHPRARLSLWFRFLADGADMESAAVAEAALRAGLPFLAVRCVSDLAGSDSLAQFRRNLPMAAERAALAALGALAWAEGRR